MKVGQFTNKKFWEGTTDRVIRTAGQFALAYLIYTFGPEIVDGSGFSGLDINLAEMGGWALGGIALSFVTSIAFPKKVIDGGVVNDSTGERM